MRLQVIDSHTGGEPTRVVLGGQVALQGSTMEERRESFRRDFDHVRTGTCCEPRGNEVMVGALLTEPVTQGADVGVIYYNVAGYLGMCGHGTIGVVETLRHLGRVAGDTVKLDTPVGLVTARILPDGWISLTNVLARVKDLDVTVEVREIGTVTGDVAWGGNWFYIVRSPRFDVSLSRATELTAQCWAIRRELVAQGITGDDGAEIDHVELFTPQSPAGADSQNFVQCPGGAYDRSPCGTGTSAKLACLFARGELVEGQVYRQMSPTGSVFRGSVRACDGGVIPTIEGQAHVTGEATLIFSENDPIRWGLG